MAAISLLTGTFSTTLDMMDKWPAKVSLQSTSARQEFWGAVESSLALRFASQDIERIRQFCRLARQVRSAAGTRLIQLCIWIEYLWWFAHH
jgi:hypothetical protein